MIAAFCYLLLHLISRELHLTAAPRLRKLRLTLPHV